MSSASVKRSSPITSSLPLQIFLYYNGWMIFAYVCCTIATFVWKSERMPYPGFLLGWESAAFALLALIDICRVALGSKGNRTRSVGALVRRFVEHQRHLHASLGEDLP